jgi:hypothetical protein
MWYYVYTSVVHVSAIGGFSNSVLIYVLGSVNGHIFKILTN